MVNLNGFIFNDLPPELEQAQRALYYGDGLFETLRAEANGSLPHLRQHVARLLSGLNLLEFVAPPHWSEAFFEAEIGRTLPAQSATAHRVRVTVWRSPGGLYLPLHHEPQFLISVAPITHLNPSETGLRVGFCQSVRLPVDAFSNLKTLNAPRYVAAAREARRSGWDDALLLNQFDRVCEATSSNFFWQTADGHLYTPPLTEGCVAGTTRERVLELAQKQGISVSERAISPQNLLLEVESAFFTNAIRGVVPVGELAGRTLRIRPVEF